MESKLILGPEDSPIKPAYDAFLDAPPTRRELQRVFNKIGVNQTQIWEAVDTQALVGNFICEKLSVTRGEIEVYVAKVAAATKETQAAEAEAKKNA